MVDLWKRQQEEKEESNLRKKKIAEKKLGIVFELASYQILETTPLVRGVCVRGLIVRAKKTKAEIILS